MGLGLQHLAGLAADLRGGLAHGARVEDVDAAQAAADGDDLTAQGADGVGVVGLEVAEDQRDDTGRRRGRSASG